MKKAIIYDFDKTIYSKETSIQFMLYYISKKPFKIFKLTKNLIKILFNLKNLENTKNIFFSIFKDDDNIDKLIEDFWKTQKKNIYEYFFDEISFNKKQAEVLILISASPDFLLEKIYKILGFDILIATKYDNFKMVSKNCKQVEKLKRLKEVGEFDVLAFYSDSISDMPLFEIAKEKYTIKNGKKYIGVPNKTRWIDKWL